MPGYSTVDIRNVVLVGHASAGKTSLAEALLHKSGSTRRLGSVDDQTSHLDYTDEEKEKGCSFDSAIGHLEHKGKHINIVDTPGLTGFAGPAIAALASADIAICVVSAKDGIQVNTRKMMERAGEYGLARIIAINKIDTDSADFDSLVGQLEETFGLQCACVNLPTNKAQAVVDCFANESGDADFSDVGTMHEKLVEAIVGVDDTLMEKYLGGELPEDELAASCTRATAQGATIPIVFTNAKHDVGITELLDVICTFGPSPVDANRRTLTSDDTQQPIVPNGDGPFVGQVFKITGDPKSNIKYSVIRCLSGQLKPDTNLHTEREKRGMKAGHLHKMLGAEHAEIDVGIPGDLVAVAKLDLKIGDVVFTDQAGKIAMPPTPKPMFSMAIEPEARGDVEKISGALQKYTEEDPCFEAERDPATHELVIYGLGDLHLRTMLQRMEKQFGLHVTTHPPRIPYRETITKAAREVEYTHKKQTGGAGQFGRVIITVEPTERGMGYEFVDEIFGGAIDQQFRPSVDKGVKAQMAEGVLAGYPVVDVRVRLTDGKTHPVDSKDIAFQIAGRQAFKEGFMKANPILLEPIVTMEITTPSDNVGDIQGDLAARRGRPVGQDMLPGGFTVIKAIVPLAEVSNYSSQLSSITGGQGSYTMELSHYDQVPGNIQQQIIEKAKKQREEAAAG